MKEFLITNGVLIFFICQLINVILSTMRSIITIKGSVHLSAVFNAISYTFYAGVVKLITNQDMTVVLIVTLLTNLMGVYIARFILDKMTKDKLWVFNATLKTKNCSVEKIVEMLKVAEIKYIYSEIIIDKLYSFQIFAPTQKESKMIKEILSNYDIKFYITEAK